LISKVRNLPEYNSSLAGTGETRKSAGTQS
jgi:hypothetical protein